MTKEFTSLISQIQAEHGWPTPIVAALEGGPLPSTKPSYRGQLSLSLEGYLNDLRDQHKPLRHSGLLQLSSLSPEELVEFKAMWSSLSQGRKSEVLSKLVELTEDNLELDFSAVYRACLGDEDHAVREAATRGLWECDDRVIIRPLISLVRDDPSTEVRAAAAISLGKFAEMAQEGKLIERDAEKVRDALLAVIEDEGEDPEARRRAIEAVASFDSPEVEQIIQEAYQSGDDRLRQSAIFAMGRSSDPQWLPIILEEMRHEDPAIRYEATSACGQLGDESNVPHVISLIQDEDSQVQVSAVQALAAIGGMLAKRALLQCQRLGDELLEEAAEAALSNIEFDEDPLGFRFRT